MAQQGGYNVTASAVPSSVMGMASAVPSSVRLTPPTRPMAGAEEHKWRSKDVPLLRETTSSLEQVNQRAGIYEPIEDKRKVDGDANTGRNLLSQSGGAEPGGGQSGPSESTRKDPPAPPPGIQQPKYRNRRRRRRQAAEGPRVEVSDRPAPGGRTTLDCKARGFSTPNITLAWLKNGEPWPQETRWEKPLLNGNGIYQAGAAIDIDPSPGDKYTCRVEHPSLPGVLHKDWEPTSERSLEPNTRLIVGVSVGLPLFLGVVLLVVYFCYRRNRRRHHRQDAGESASL